MRKCMEEVELLLKSKFPCIWINSYEEDQVITDLKELSYNLTGFNLYTWSCSSGLKKEILGNISKENEPEKTPIEKVFSMIQNKKNDNNFNKNIWVLKDFHSFIDNKILMRAVRDIEESITANYNPIIIISPITNIPIDLEKLFQVINYDLPNKELIEKIVDCACKQLKQQNKTLPTEQDKKSVINGLSGLTFNEIKQTIAKSLIKYKTLNPNIINETKIQLIQKSGVLEYKEPKVTMKDIGGNNSFKKWYNETKELFSEEAIKFGCKPPKGCLNLGVPGCGKSILAEAIAADLKVPFLKLEMSKILSKFVGSSEQNIAQAFRIVDSCAPCVLLIDEAEKALSGKII